jgi:hypothetical protein
MKAESVGVCLCIPQALLGYSSVKTFSPQRKIIEGVVFRAIHVVSKERRRLVLPRTSCFIMNQSLSQIVDHRYFYVEAIAIGERTVTVAARRFVVRHISLDVAKFQLCSSRKAETVTPSQRATTSRCLRISGRTTYRKSWCHGYHSGGLLHSGCSGRGFSSFSDFLL